METVEIKISTRTEVGKIGVAKVRSDGKVPGVLYGQNADSICVGMDPRDIIRVLRSSRGQNTPLELGWEGDSSEGLGTLALIRDYQVHPVKRKLLHVDLLRVEPSTTILAMVPIVCVGKSEGEERGGKLVRVTREIKVRCRVDQIPENLELDVTPYSLGFTMYSKDLTFPEGVEPAFRGNFPIFSISEVRVLMEEEEVETEGEEGETEGGQEASAENEES